MRDPNTALFQKWTELMASGDMTGSNRPVGRVTVGRNAMHHHFSPTRPGIWRNFLFEGHRQVELPYVQSIDINRSIGQDAQTCTITVINDSMDSRDYRPQGIDTGIGRPGYRTFSRGATPTVNYTSVYESLGAGQYPTTWNYPVVGDEPGWDKNLDENLNPVAPGYPRKYDGGSGGSGGPDAIYNYELLVPNRIVRTFQGYGSDNFDEDLNMRERWATGYVPPYDDKQLVQTGIWLIDSVSLGTNGLIEIQCRDLGKLLLEQVIYPHMGLIPMERFPLIYSPGTGAPGLISDWSEAFKELLGWSGLTWFVNPLYYGTGIAADPLIGNDANGHPLRIWGEFEWLGAGPVQDTTPEFFLNKSFMDGLTQIKDFLGCVFFFSENGGAIFRLPNIFNGGQYLHQSLYLNPPTRLYRQWPIELHENANLIDYSVTVDDSQLRSEILVVAEWPNINSAGPVAGGVRLTDDDNPSALNFTQLLAGQERLFLVPADATKGFTTAEECQRMAELTALMIMFSYRKGRARAPCHPGLQLDDQVRIFERISHEFNVHYVSGIQTHWDINSGEFIMDLTTHWLGDNADSNWIIKKASLSPAVLNLPAVQARLGST